MSRLSVTISLYVLQYRENIVILNQLKFEIFVEISVLGFLELKKVSLQNTRLCVYLLTALEIKYLIDFHQIRNKQQLGQYNLHKNGFRNILKITPFRQVTNKNRFSFFIKTL